MIWVLLLVVLLLLSLPAQGMTGFVFGWYNPLPATRGASYICTPATRSLL